MNNEEKIAAALAALSASRKYIEQANHTATVEHDSPGEGYLDPGLYETMRETSKLLETIDALLG